MTTSMERRSPMDCWCNLSSKVSPARYWNRYCTSPPKSACRLRWPRLVWWSYRENYSSRLQLVPRPRARRFTMSLSRCMPTWWPMPSGRPTRQEGPGKSTTGRRGEVPMSEPEYVDPRELRPGPIRHESLPPDLLGQIRAVYDVIGPYVGVTLEQFEIG